MNLPLQKAELRAHEQAIAAVPEQLIGHIVSVSGPRAIAVLESPTQTATFRQVPRVQIGALLKISTPTRPLWDW
jgi:hypothetical protein